jgi:hypothetical protein
MSDAEKQSIEKCIRHDWYKVPYSETTNEYFVCRRCNHLAKGKEIKRAEAYVFLRSVLPKGSTVYTILKHVSRSGMTRGIDCYALTVEADGNGGTVARPLWITSWVGHAIDSPQPIDYWRKSLGLKVGGCGMDMGFHVVNSLSCALYDDGYAIKHQWL